MEINEIIGNIKKMHIKDKLRFVISIFSSNYINTRFNKKKMFEKMDNQLKKIVKNYIISFSEINNNKFIMFMTAKIIEITKEEKNRITMYLVNCV